jgi:hypothetical protein
MITHDSTVRVSPRISVVELSGESVILDLDSGQYFGVNSVGSFILERLQTAHPVKELVAAVTDSFEISEEIARADTLAFLNSLAGSRLVTITD